MNARKQILACIGLVFFAVVLLLPSGAQADFGLKSFTTTAANSDASADSQAGSHPYEYTVRFDMNQDSEGKPEGTLRDLFVNLPPGMVGDPTAVHRCKRADFEGAIPNCPADTQVGVVYIHLKGIEGHGPEGSVGQPLYNLTPPLGAPASFGFSVIEYNSFQEASLRSGGDFGVNIADITVPTNILIQSITETIWGVPGDPSHDALRGECFEKFYRGEPSLCPSGLPPTPFLTLPTACGAPLETTLSVDSLQNPGVFDSKTVLSEDEGKPSGLVGCNALEFEPRISSQPTTDLADSPTGLNFNIHQHQNEASAGNSTAALKDVKVTLPAGMTLNPSAANGLGACSEAQIGYQPSGGQIHFSEAPQSCPDASKLGTLEVNSPLVDHELRGAIYLAQPYQNPFSSLLAIYLAVEDEQTGIIAKLAGRVEPDAGTGQITANFKDNPQLPIEDIETHFFKGPQAALKTPLACGEYTTTSDLTPWSTPEGADAIRTDSFATSVAAAGSGPCPRSEAEAPNSPSFTAGTLAPKAGAYSPFLLKLSRPDGSQQLTGLDITLPKGLTGKLAGIPYCSEAQISQAKSREAPNQGALEQQSPSCPLASEVGTVVVGAGAGTTPFYAQGHAYLAGPYKGAPLSLVIITPAVAGPFDLGTVVVRTALYVNSETAQIHPVSDPFPTILQGIPLDLRSIALNMSKPDFTLNPTSCDPTAVLGSAIAASGQSAALNSPFQVGACNALGFKPNLSLNLKGATKRNKNPALKAILTYPKGNYANISRASVALPHSEFLDQSHIQTVCTRVQFAAGQTPGEKCPKASVYGKARAITPLLDKPLQGPVYLRSSSHELPDLVAALKGQINIVLDGRIDTDKADGIRTTFEGVPDAPVSKFVLEMKGGKKGLLVNSTNICRSTNRATVKLRAQNAKTHDFNPVVGNSCAKKPGK